VFVVIVMLDHRNIISIVKFLAFAVDI